ncbi:MAG: FMN-binding protein, partial [Mailhella sp.]
TAGVGTRVKEAAFLKQFPGKAIPVRLRNQGGDIDAVSGATVSSNGVMNAIDQAVSLYKELKPLLLETWK